MTRRKHRLYLDITYNLKLTHREAVKAALMLLDRLDIGAKPIYLSEPDLYCDKITVTEIKS